MTEADSNHMRNCSPETKVGTRCHQHHVVWPRRDRGDEGKTQEGREKLICHAASIRHISWYFVANGAIFGLFPQLMIKIDDTDHRILRALSRNGRISNLDLADRIGLSPSACLRRVQELERIESLKDTARFWILKSWGLGLLPI